MIMEAEFPYRHLQAGKPGCQQQGLTQVRRPQNPSPSQSVPPVLLVLNLPGFCFKVFILVLE
jgi:hypothetical protein